MLFEAYKFAPEIGEFLRACVQAGVNSIVVGSDSLGRATMLNALLNLISHDNEIIAFNETPQGELRLLGRDNKLSKIWADPITDLFVINVEEAKKIDPTLKILPFLASLNRNSPSTALGQLQRLLSFYPSWHVLWNFEQVASMLIVIHVERLANGSLHILNIKEIQGLDNGQIQSIDIFEFEQTGIEKGKAAGRLRPTGLRPKCMDRLDAAGLHLPPSVFGIGSSRFDSSERPSFSRVVDESDQPASPYDKDAQADITRHLEPLPSKAIPVPSAPAEPASAAGEIPDWLREPIEPAEQVEQPSRLRQAAPTEPASAPVEPVAPAAAPPPAPQPVVPPPPVPRLVPTPVVPPPAEVASSTDEPLGGMDPMAWLESLAKRQGANTEELVTKADLDIPSPPPDTVIDEPGYTPGYDTGKPAAKVEPAGVARATAPVIKPITPIPTPPPALEPALAADEIDLLTTPLTGVERLAKQPEADVEALAPQADLDIPLKRDMVIDEPDYAAGDTAGKKPEPAKPELVRVTPPSAPPLPKVETPAPLAAPLPAAKPQTDEVFFTAFYPREVQPLQRYGLFVYAHIQGVLREIARDVQKFKDELGGTVPSPKKAKMSARLQKGTPITVTIECNEIEFNPASLTKKWEDDWTRFDFDFKVKADLAGETMVGRVSISAYGIEIAHIDKFSFEVEDRLEVIPYDKASDLAPDPLAFVRPQEIANPLAAAKSLISQTAKIYHRIFVSYSRQDRAVAESYRLAQLAMGNDVFMDTYSIRTGEDWRAALAQAIDSADIFQLFWSENSAVSPNVKDEWEYALTFKCPETHCASFIRPVYWTTPLPVKPPDELSHLNFRYVPMLGE